MTPGEPLIVGLIVAGLVMIGGSVLASRLSRRRRTAADILRDHEARVMRSVRETPQLPPLPDGWDVERDRPRAIVVRDATNGRTA